MKFLDEFPFPVWRAGLDGKCDYFNKAWLDFTGRTLKQELGDGWTSGVHPEDLSACLSSYREAFQAHVQFQLQYRLRGSDSEFHWVIDYGSPFNDGAGNFAGYIGVCYDITERKRVEETLRKAEWLFVAFMNHLPGFAWIKDLEGRYTYANASVQELQADRGDRVGRTDSEAWPPEVSTIHCANDKIVIDTGKPLQTVEPYLREGELREALVSKFPIFDSSGAVESVGGVGIDITERLKAERADAELAAIVKCSNDAIIGETLDGVIISWNKSAERIYGYLASEAIGRPITILTPPELQGEIRKILERIKRGESIEHLETTHLRKDGRQISVSLTISPIKNSKGEIIGASANSHDTTEQRQAEHALLETEQLVRDLAGNINEVLWLTDPDNTRMFYVSPAYERVWGRSCASLYSAPKSWMDAVYPEDKERVFATIGRQPCTQAHDFTYRIIRPDGSLRWIRDRGFPVRMNNGEILRFAGLAEDITEGKQTQEVLDKASRQLRDLSRRRIKVQEDERKHLARELHDQIGQGLTAAKISVRSVKRLRKREAMARQLDKATAILDQILLQVRQITLNLRPSALDDLGLAAALRLILDDYAKRGGWQARFFEEDNLERADAEVETICFRIVLEALTNILRHAQAQKVSLKLGKKGDSLHLSRVR